jgi:hypothetical protein
MSEKIIVGLAAIGIFLLCDNLGLLVAFRNALGVV